MVRFTHYDRLCAVLFSQVAVGATLSMVDAKSGEVLWKVSRVSRKQEGGVSTTAWAIVLTAISTAIHIRKVEQQRRGRCPGPGQLFESTRRCEGERVGIRSSGRGAPPPLITSLTE